MRIEADFTKVTGRVKAMHGVGQIRADGQTDAVARGAVSAAVEHKIAVCCALALVVEPAEDMIEL